MAMIDRNKPAKETRRVLITLVENKPGVLTRVASLFRRRNFNIESLTVGHTDSPDVSRMTIVVDATRTNAEMVQRNLLKMVNVIDVQDVSHAPAVFRDLALIKVQADNQARFEIMQLVNVYRARVVDICADSLIVEVTGPEVKINSLVEMLTPYGIIEMVRTGLVAMVRGSGHASASAQADWENGEAYEDGYEEEEAEVAAPTLLRM